MYKFVLWLNNCRTCNAVRCAHCSIAQKLGDNYDSSHWPSIEDNDMTYDEKKLQDYVKLQNAELMWVMSERETARKKFDAECKETMEALRLFLQGEGLIK